MLPPGPVQDEEDAVNPARLLRIAGAYHGALGVVLLLLPRDLFAFLKVEEPRQWLFYYLTAVVPLVAAIVCEVARRRSDLRPGLVFGLVLGNVTAAAVVIFFVAWSDLPQVLLGTGVAAGLWAWLLWGVYSPEAAELPTPDVEAAPAESEEAQG
jgi:hypothetical protein